MIAPDKTGYLGGVPDYPVPSKPSFLASVHQSQLDEPFDVPRNRRRGYSELRSKFLLARSWSFDQVEEQFPGSLLGECAEHKAFAFAEDSARIEAPIQATSRGPYSPLLLQEVDVILYVPHRQTQVAAHLPKVHPRILLDVLVDPELVRSTIGVLTRTSPSD